MMGPTVCLACPSCLLERTVCRNLADSPPNTRGSPNSRSTMQNSATCARAPRISVRWCFLLLTSAFKLAQRSQPRWWVKARCVGGAGAIWTHSGPADRGAGGAARPSKNATKPWFSASDSHPGSHGSPQLSYIIGTGLTRRSRIRSAPVDSRPQFREIDHGMSVSRPPGQIMHRGKT